MKHLFSLLVFILIADNVKCQSPTLDWAYIVGKKSFSIAEFPNNEICIGGSFSGTSDFDPGSGTYNLTSQGSDDCFIQRIDSNGNLIWATSFGGPQADEIHDVSIDYAGNIVVIGTFSSTADFDPGPGTSLLTSNGNGDVFVAKYTSTGTFLWAQSFGGSTWDLAEGCTTDSAGNIFLTGTFQNTVDFDPGPGIVSVTSTGNNDIYVIKYDENGNFLWVNTHGSTGYDYGHDVAIDNSQNLIVVGGFEWTIDFDPGPATNTLTATLYANSFVQKLDNDGNYIWAKSMEGGYNFAKDVVIDDTNNIYLVGHYQDSIDLDPGPGSAVYYSLGVKDMFCGKLDSMGNMVWSNSLGGPLTDKGEAIDIDTNGNTYITGTYRVQIPGGIYDINTLDDVLFAKLDPTGNYVWIDSIGGDSEDAGLDILVDSTFHVYVVGKIIHQVDLDPGPQTQNFNAGLTSGFVLKLDTCLAIQTQDVVTACDSYSWIDGNTYTSSNNSAMYVYPSSNGCDSIVYLDLTIGQSNTGTDIQYACDSYTWINGNTYVASTNLPTYTLTNSSGCDSVVSLNLTINNSSSGIDTQSACDSYTWIDGNTYTSNTNTPTWLLSNINGCDSTVTLNLTINSADNTVSQLNETTIEAVASNANCQWLDCDNNFSVIQGENSQTFTAASNGNYAVEVEQNGCTDTSACITISQVSLDSPIPNGFINLHPNPTDQFVYIEFPSYSERRELVLLDMYGRIVSTYNTSTGKNITIEIIGEKGIYFLQKKENGRIETYKIIKK